MTICVAIKNCIVVQLIHFLVARLMVIMLQKVSCSQYFCFLNNISSKIFSRIIFLLSKRKKKKKKKKSLYLYVIVVSQPKRSFFPKCFFFQKIQRCNFPGIVVFSKAFVFLCFPLFFPFSSAGHSECFKILFSFFGLVNLAAFFVLFYFVE